MPLIRNNGRYGELGHWGKRSGRRFTKKKILLLGTLLSFSLIFAISHNGNIIPVVNAGDYNSSFSHTRTLIFGDTQFLGPKTVGQTTFQASTFVDQCTITCSSPTLATSSGNFLMVHTDCWSSSGADIGTVTDTLANTFTRIVSQTFGGIDSIWKASSAGGSDSVTVSKGTCGTFSFSFEVYSGATGLGVNNQDTGSSANTSGSDTLTITISANSLIYEAWSVSNGNSNCPTLSAGSGQSLRETFTCFVTGGNRLDGSSLDKQFTAGGSTPSTANWGNGGGGVTWSHMIVELLSGSASLDFSKVRWSFNSTCVSLAGPASPEADFDYSKGVVGTGGANCSSADIMISKTSINLQTVSARMLEMVMAWANVKPALKNVTMVLRASNTTLPSFRENYNPFLDMEARLIWTACPVATCSPSGNQTLYIGHDLTKTITQESLGNDKIIGVTNPNFKPGVQNSFQVVLNFTGPINFMSGSNQTSTQDPINRVACGLGTPQPTFDFNPLDPSTWGNAIIKGLVWAFSVAVPSGLQIIAQVLLQVIQVTFNFVGNFFGWGNIGDNFVTFLNGIPVLFGQIGTAFGWIASIVSSAVNTIIIANLLANPYFAGVINVLNDFKNAIGSGIIVSFLTQLAIWFPTSYMIILISTYFLFVFLKGLEGFFDWLHLVKWSTFILIGLFTTFIHSFGSLITAILGRLSIISPGHEFPKIHHPKAGHWPKVSLGGEIAFFDDPTAWFLAFTGFIFTMVWAGTTGAGLPGNTQTVIQAMTPLFTTLFGVGFMILLLYIPGFVLGKLHEKGMIS